MKKAAIILLASLLALSMAGVASALTITANASGDAQPTTAIYPDTVQNGDFLISGNAIATLVGNGVDEYTTWAFDFTGDPGFGMFSVSDTLTEANLTLTLTPMNGLITTDSIRIDGLPVIVDPIQSLPVGVSSTVNIDLLVPYDSGAILGELFGGNVGEIAMTYQDDAILTYAQLDLTIKPVPEPSSLVLLGLSLAGLLVVRKRIRK